MDTIDTILLVVIAIGIFWTYITLTSSKLNPKVSQEAKVQQKMDAIRAAIKVPGIQLSSELQKKRDKYVSLDVDVDKDYPGWDKNPSILRELCEDGRKFLEFHQVKTNPTAMKIADAYVAKLVTKLEAIPGEIEEVPWEGGWYQPSTILTRFLATYVFIGANPNLIEACKVQLLRLIPEVGTCMKKTHSGLNLIKVSVPRLCVTFLNPAAFAWDTATQKFQEIKDFMNFARVEADDVQDGAYGDGSVIVNSVATYERFLDVYGFYEAAIRGMGVETNLKDLAVKIFPKLTHPDVPFYPLGLFRSNGNRTTISLWSWTLPKTGISLLPFIGLGVFKTEDFVFYVRVQRPDVCACGPLEPGLVAGCIQIRRIFLKDKKYPTSVTEDNVADEPGVISVDGGGKTLEKKEKYNCSDVEALIGRLETSMFWMNSYKFQPLYGDVKITEAGVVTADGLQILYKIVNASSKTLKFRHADPVSGFDVNHVKESSSGFVRIPRGIKEFVWTMTTRPINYKVALTTNGMTFELAKVKHYVNVIKTNKQFMVKFGGKTIFGSSSSREMEISYGGKKYKRNLDTMMYEIEN